MTEKMNNEKAAEYLGVHPSTLATWRSEGKSPVYYKFPTGGRVYYLESDLDEWLRGGRYD